LPCGVELGGKGGVVLLIDGFFFLGRCHNVTFKERKEEGESNEKLCKRLFLKLQHLREF